MDKYLYRGVNEGQDNDNAGKLIPKLAGEPFKSHAYYGEAEYNDGSVYGESERNAVVRHQKDSNKYPTSGISTTPVIENAITYATHRGKYTKGYVYKIDTSLLEKYGVSSFLVSEHATQPAIPDDKEVILVANDNNALPNEIIIEKNEV